MAENSGFMAKWLQRNRMQDLERAPSGRKQVRSDSIHDDCYWQELCLNSLPKYSIVKKKTMGMTAKC